jgi:hypothetical protein
LEERSSLYNPVGLLALVLLLGKAEFVRFELWPLWYET